MKLQYQRIVYVVADGLLAMLALYLAAVLRFDGNIALEYMADLPTLLVIATGTFVLGGFVCKTYNSLLSYMGFNEVFRQLGAALFSGLLFFAIKLIDTVRVSGSITLIYVGIVFALSSSIRGIPRMRRWIYAKQDIAIGKSRPTVIVGAGNAGAMIIRRLLDDPQEGFYPVAVVDDDPQKLGCTIAGISVVGSTNQVAAACEKYRAEQVVIAIPSADEVQINRIYDCCVHTKLPVKLFRSVVDIENYFAGDQRALKDVSIEDLLFRDTVQPDMKPVYEFLKGKRVMVTGAAGSIGSEICRQVLSHGCAHLTLFDIHENGLFEMNEELKSQYDTGSYALCIGSVRDKSRLDEVMAQHQPEIVLHAAAHKHVPMMELNPTEAVKNNIYGTKNVLECCAAHGVKRFILISTDKAVNPTNVMGATKRVAELLVQRMNGAGGCEMAAVRFGNVLGSNGSVIPTFQKQIAAGGPVTVTDKNMMRYFMTIPEAVSLVLSAGTLAQGGEVFVLDMGKPIRIYDLAKGLIKLSGLEPGKDIPIQIVGLRPGEKLFEEISLDSEIVDHTSHARIFVLRHQSQTAAFDWEALDARVLRAAGKQGICDCLFDAIGVQRPCAVSGERV